MSEDCFSNVMLLQLLYVQHLATTLSVIMDIYVTAQLAMKRGWSEVDSPRLRFTFIIWYSLVFVGGF